MDSREISRERISAFADGELAHAHLSATLAALHEPAEQATWSVYHQIGDALRSEEMAFELSEGFAAKMRASLAAEPAMIAIPAYANAVAEVALTSSSNSDNRDVSIRPHKNVMRRLAISSGAAATLVAALMLVTGSQQSVLVSNNTNVAAPMAAPQSVTNVAAAGTANGSVLPVSSLSQQGEVARDPRIDEYLLAHQRFSPSMYSSAQYARSAGFNIDSDK